jgi:hypothetical protein
LGTFFYEEEWLFARGYYWFFQGGFGRWWLWFGGSDVLALLRKMSFDGFVCIGAVACGVGVSET